ncbi:hypothetical protein N7539_005767 [Penicillium diatomitis]|uniref:SET domain-containing protein n=1 Tax=Penicillium diatomitis TaxID=2819901 RepID=A0A9X0BTZ0_9EURO|nr:uncharacterized protein N7539_005767 [Penicillium diatomitis]KAJ5483971.1 hypothetical protein N7539_005767 [Penicillium diatomitis]
MTSPTPTSLLEARASKTTEIYADPHNPHLYLDRARVYEQLGFPDLAAADAYRALSLLESVVDPDGCEFHARKVARRVEGDEVGRKHDWDGNQDGTDTTDEDGEDEDEDEEDGVPITQGEYEAVIGEVYAVLVRSLVRCGCYRDAFEFGVRGKELLEEMDAAKRDTCALNILNGQLDSLKGLYQSRTGTKGAIDLDAIDPAILPAQGFARRILYPWNEHEPDRKAPEELAFLNERLKEVAPKCEVRAVALPALHGDVPDEDEVSVQLGLFAKENIAADEIILRETSILTATNRLHDDLCDACNAPLPDLSSENPPVGCEGGCADTVFCSQKCHDTAQTVYHGAICGLEDGLESIGKDIPDPKDKADYLYLLLLGRALAMSATQDIHALDLPEVKYIWGDFHDWEWKPSLHHMKNDDDRNSNNKVVDESATLPFSFQLNILQPTRFLEEMEINPYTSLARYDTWILNTLYAKFRGTASGRLSTWDGGPELCAVHPLWCLANHSCDPNVRWEWGGEITFRARNDEETAVWARTLDNGQIESRAPKKGGIAKDEEILNHYCDIGLDVQERRGWARGALGGNCRCERCIWEALED